MGEKSVRVGADLAELAPCLAHLDFLHLDLLEDPPSRLELDCFVEDEAAAVFVALNPPSNHLAYHVFARFSRQPPATRLTGLAATHALVLGFGCGNHGVHECCAPQEPARHVEQDQANDRDHARDTDAFDGREKVPPEPDGQKVVPDVLLRLEAFSVSRGNDVLTQGRDGLEGQKGPDYGVRGRGAEIADPADPLISTAYAYTQLTDKSRASTPPPIIRS